MEKVPVFLTTLFVGAAAFTYFLNKHRQAKFDREWSEQAVADAKRNREADERRWAEIQSLTFSDEEMNALADRLTPQDKKAPGWSFTPPAPRSILSPGDTWTVDYTLTVDDRPIPLPDPPQTDGRPIYVNVKQRNRDGTMFILSPAFTEFDDAVKECQIVAALNEANLEIGWTFQTCTVFLKDKR